MARCVIEKLYSAGFEPVASSCLSDCNRLHYPLCYLNMTKMVCCIHSVSSSTSYSTNTESCNVRDSSTPLMIDFTLYLFLLYSIYRLVESVFVSWCSWCSVNIFVDQYYAEFLFIFTECAHKLGLPGNALFGCLCRFLNLLAQHARYRRSEILRQFLIDKDVSCTWIEQSILTCMLSAVHWIELRWAAHKPQTTL